METMKKTLLGVMTLATLGGLALPALAQATPAKPIPVAATRAAADASKPTHVIGTVVSASAKDHALTVKSADGEHLLVVAPKAIIHRAGKPITLGDVHAGQKVDATVRKVDGKDTADALSISS